MKCTVELTLVKAMTETVSQNVELASTRRDHPHRLTRQHTPKDRPRNLVLLLFFGQKRVITSSFPSLQLDFGVRRHVAALKARTCPRSPKSRLDADAVKIGAYICGRRVHVTRRAGLSGDIALDG
jgi:hypothetical protein